MVSRPASLVYGVVPRLLSRTMGGCRVPLFSAYDVCSRIPRIGTFHYFSIYNIRFTGDRNGIIPKVSNDSVTSRSSSGGWMMGCSPSTDHVDTSR